MSNSDSDSDTPVDIGQLGLPSIHDGNEADDVPNHNHEEGKVEGDHEDAHAKEESKKSEKFNKFREQTKDLVSKAEKPKQLYLANTKITKVGDDSTTSESSSAKPKHLEINDPRFNYDVILSKGYKLLRKMGNGAYASVFLCERVAKPDQKCVLKISIGEERMPDTQNEYEILSHLDLYSIPKVKELILDNEYYYSIICMEYSNIDQNVLQYVNEHGSLEEHEVRLAMKELFKALEYIHSLDYAHRDVKPDNVLIKISPSEQEEGKSNVKVILVDYNIAKKAKSYRVKESEDSKDDASRFRCNYLTHIASQNSQAPELFKSGYYTESVDIWGAGLVMFTLLTGEKLKRGDQEVIKTQVDNLSKLSEKGKELLHQLFAFEGEARPTAEEAIEHPWFSE